MKTEIWKKEIGFIDGFSKMSLFGPRLGYSLPFFPVQNPISAVCYWRCVEKSLPGGPKSSKRGQKWPILGVRTSIFQDFGSHGGQIFQDFGSVGAILYIKCEKNGQK